MATSNTVDGNFIRQYKLLLGASTKTPNTGKFESSVDLDNNLGTSSNSQNMRVIDSMQIKATIKKDNNKEPNKAQISIYNLEDDSVNYINKNIRNNLAVALATGYRDAGSLDVIFKGTVQWISDTWQGVDRVTTLHCVDGGINLSLARTSRTYAKGTKVKDIIGGLVTDLGASSGNVVVDSSTTISSACSMSGSTSFYLNHICNGIDHNFSIQDGSVFVTPRSKMFSSRSAYISADSGLIGSPQPFHNDVKPTKSVTKSSKKAKKPTDGIRFKCEINGAILPEKTVWLKSNDYDSGFKVVSVTHNIDFEGNTFTTDVEAVSVSAYITN